MPLSSSYSFRPVWALCMVRMNDASERVFLDWPLNLLDCEFCLRNTLRHARSDVEKTCFQMRFVNVFDCDQLNLSPRFADIKFGRWPPKMGT
eukprot:6414992-Pyramimonas_sp.AAC.1